MLLFKFVLLYVCLFIFIFIYDCWLFWVIHTSYGTPRRPVTGSKFLTEHSGIKRNVFENYGTFLNAQISYLRMSQGLNLEWNNKKLKKNCYNLQLEFSNMRKF